ncbi:protein of unknown function DUF1680 [Caldicellulosiruptor kronotskyensis 2002]|uniref:Glycoside hydrolase family 127 protein n=1 Tax=Caldicellulosiruptor kronotskyensis (strain DSM 18902 / VKM B-2412 / 2002) TaxID=632348 RepID=E4SEI4_CALK2|nr:beta-L-arabinofuranosidase domain-containing protein [Caldicellulosiruptor kronotskyensis]ADQ45471.1 protein of unknown function DUF1680 [Caldicellulosiruptor kronotskyensis 2002]
MKGHGQILIPLKASLLNESEFYRRFEINRNYMLSLKTENLLQNFYLESGLVSWSFLPQDIHGGWESPTCQLRGHFLGHWLSAAAKIYANFGDEEIKGKADYIINELEKCQRENGGEWVGSIPEKYFEWMARGKYVWAPHYTVHKTFMGLVDMYKYASNQKALEIADKWANWFYRWSGQFSREKMDDILDYETGGMLEIWAELYDITKDSKYKDLMERYYRGRLFDRLLMGEDVLTGKHANTTIPEIHGAARVWEITGEEKFRKIVESYWKEAVDERGYFCTGGQTLGEVWTPKQKIKNYLGTTNQEHCVVYNMIRLAEFLFRWTGDKRYSDYIERNIYNGLFAQQRLKDGMVTYYLPLMPGSQKRWGTPTNDFWCCHGTLVQAHTIYNDLIYYKSQNGIVISQFIPSSVTWKDDKGNDITITQYFERKHGSFAYTAEKDEIYIEIQCKSPVEFELAIRKPWWAKKVEIEINGNSYYAADDSPYIQLTQRWNNEKIKITFYKAVETCSMPDDPQQVAFMIGPVVLAGLCERRRKIYIGERKIEEIIVPIDKRGYGPLLYTTQGQIEDIFFLPLCYIDQEKYTVYFLIDE